MDNLMLNTASQTYLKLPKRGEWHPEHMKIFEFMQIFSDIKIINEDDPNLEIILKNPDWDDFEDVLRQIEDTQPSPNPSHSQKLIRTWGDLPANAQTVAVVESCISYLHDHHPYPANMKIDRTAFAGSRVAYAAAIYHLERFMAELTEEIKLEEMADEEEVI